jgi:hypothetical protein
MKRSINEQHYVGERQKRGSTLWRMRSSGSHRGTLGSREAAGFYLAIQQ